MTRTIWTNFRSRILRSLHMKFEFDWPSGFRGEDVWKCWRTDGRTDGRTTDGRTDDGVTGILLAHPWAFGSGELKKYLRERIRKEVVIIRIESYFFCASLRYEMPGKLRLILAWKPSILNYCIENNTLCLHGMKNLSLMIGWICMNNESARTSCLCVFSQAWVTDFSYHGTQCIITYNK